MRRYGNASGNSGVVAYEPFPDALDVAFRNGEAYKYTASSVGTGTLRRMKALAEAGEGLSGFISREVRDKYTRRWRWR